MPALQVQHIRQQERQLQTLRRVQPWIAMRVIAIRQRLARNRHRAADALGHVLAGHLDVDAAGMGALRAVDGEEALCLRQNPFEGPGLVAAVGLDHVAVHRVAAPHHRVAFAFYRADQRG